jgi:hypothetical protein
MRSSILSALILICFGIACDDDKNDSRGLVIMTGIACGWCSGLDSLAVTGQKITYEFKGACDEPDRSITEHTQAEVWKELRTSLNWDDFKAIDVNTCALCADGCDTWIRIQNGAESHYIRFTDSSPEIETIAVFLNKLKALHEEFRRK